MIFAMMEKSTSDKNGIKGHEFLTLISFQHLYYTDRSIQGKTKLGSIPYYDLDIFSTTNKLNTLSVVVLHNVNGFLIFSHFKKENSTCLQQDQNST